MQFLLTVVYYLLIQFVTAIDDFSLLTLGTGRLGDSKKKKIKHFDKPQSLIQRSSHRLLASSDDDFDRLYDDDDEHSENEENKKKVIGEDIKNILENQQSTDGSEKHNVVQDLLLQSNSTGNSGYFQKVDSLKQRRRHRRRGQALRGMRILTGIESSYPNNGLASMDSSGFKEAARDAWQNQIEGDETSNTKVDDLVTFEVVVCNMQSGSFFATRKACIETSRAKSLEVIPVQRVECSRRLNINTVVDYMIGAQPVQTPGRTLNFANIDVLSTSLDALDRETELELSFGHCGAPNNIPNLEPNDDYMAIIILNRQAERAARNMIASNGAGGHNSNVAYRSAIMFYPLDYFFEYKNRKSDASDALMKIESCTKAVSCVQKLEVSLREGEGRAVITSGQIVLLKNMEAQPIEETAIVYHNNKKKSHGQKSIEQHTSGNEDFQSKNYDDEFSEKNVIEKTETLYDDDSENS